MEVGENYSTSAAASTSATAATTTNKVNYDRLLTAVLDALCNPMIKLRNTFPITYSPETETRCKNFSPTENLSITTSMIQAGDLTSHQFPVLNELMNYRSHLDGVRFGSWTFRYYNSFLFFRYYSKLIHQFHDVF